MVVIFPQMLANINSSMPAGQPGMPAAAMVPIMVIMCLILGIIFILIPAVWVFFYGSDSTNIRRLRRQGYARSTGMGVGAYFQNAIGVEYL